ncbi:unnamed protein product, partial [Heligmosomoides polygyrus]|uniref:SGNH/GDSL hydrolase family protein n=1 Tax=Heligmosomoides polygyrus TaxID=6339 RepID=A0A183FYX7_HELPZ
PIPIKCIFVGDFVSFGPTDANYTQEKQLIKDVSQKLFDSTSFCAGAAFYGYKLPDMNPTVLQNSITCTKNAFDTLVDSLVIDTTNDPEMAAELDLGGVEPLSALSYTSLVTVGYNGTDTQTLLPAGSVGTAVTVPFMYTADDVDSIVSAVKKGFQ